MALREGLNVLATGALPSDSAWCHPLELSRQHVQTLCNSSSIFWWLLTRLYLCSIWSPKMYFQLSCMKSVLPKQVVLPDIPLAAIDYEAKLNIKTAADD